MKQVLITFRSDYIVRFITDNPVSFQGRTETTRNTIGGDIFPPISGVEIFLELLKRKQDLFTQDYYADFYLKALNSRCPDEWEETLSSGSLKYEYKKSNETLDQFRLRQLTAFRNRCKCNFYVSMIDTLHAFALIYEAGWYDIFLIDSQDDVFSKTDLTLIRDGQKVRIALYGPKAKVDYEYKKVHRSNGQNLTGIKEIQLPYDRTKGAGNKRWYTLSDFDVIKPLEVKLEEAQSLDEVNYSFANPNIHDLDYTDRIVEEIISTGWAGK